MSKKYIKGKDGKFIGSLPSPPAPLRDFDASLPSIPAPAESNPSLEQARGLLNAHMPLSTHAIPQKSPIKEEVAEFYTSRDNAGFTVPKKFEESLENGDRLYFTANHILFTDAYHNSIADYYPPHGAKPDLLINLNTEFEGSISENITSAQDFSDLSDHTTDYFKYGGCASLAVSIHRQLPGSSLFVALGSPENDPEDTTAAHAYVMKGENIYDAFGSTNCSKYDYEKATGMDSEGWETLLLEVDVDSLEGMIGVGIFSNEFHESSSPLIDKVAALIISDSA